MSNCNNITIIDYSASNLQSVSNALKNIGAEYAISDNPAIIKKAAKVILPGVGSANAAMSALRKKGLIKVIRNLKQPFLGICLGMQLLFDWSEEGQTDCLSIITGKVEKFDEMLVKVPQIGWNLVKSQIIASGGAGSKKDVLDALTIGQADIALLASLLHFRKMTIWRIKKYLISQGVPNRGRIRRTNQSR